MVIRREDQSVNTFTVMQYADIRYWDSDYSEALSNGDTKLVGDIVLRRLIENNVPVKEFYIICHDKINPSNDNEIAEIDESKNHYHMVVRLDNVRRSLGVLSQIIGIDSKRLDPLKRGRYSYSNVLAYLIHYKDPDKFIFDPSEVVTICGRDYMEVFYERREEWLRGRAAKERELSTSRVESSDIIPGSLIDVDPLMDRKYSRYGITDLLEAIHRGEITQRDIDTYPKLAALDDLYSNAIDKAFNKKKYRYIEAVRKNLFQNDDYGFFQVYLYGPSRTGKSTAVKIFSKKLAEITDEKFHVPWRTFYSSVHGDILSGYDGEEFTVMNEFRSNSVRYEELLVIGDQQNQFFSSRFHNKLYCSRANMIVTNQTIDSFYEGLECSEAGKSSRSFYERMHLIAEIVEEDIPYEELLTRRSVKLFTHSKYHRDFLSEIISDTVPNSYFEETYNNYRELKEYDLSELISLNQLIDLLLDVLDQRMFNRMLNDLSNGMQLPEAGDLLGLPDRNPNLED